VIEALAITWTICGAALLVAWRVTGTLLELEERKSGELVVQLQDQERAAIDALDQAIREVDSKVRALESKAVLGSRGRRGVGGT